MKARLLKRAGELDTIPVEKLTESFLGKIGWASENIGEELAQRMVQEYPFEGTSVYRVVVFKTREAYDEFLNQSYQGNAKKFSGVWCKTTELALQEARSHSQPSENGGWDWHSGFNVALVEAKPDPGEGVDLDKARGGREGFTGKVWLPYNLYEIGTAHTMAFKDSIGDHNVDQELMKAIQGDFDYPKLRFILHNLNSITPEVRHKAFRFLYRSLKPWVDIRPESKWQKSGIRADIEGENERTYLLYTYFDVWTQQDQRTLLRDFKLILQEIQKEIDRDGTLDPRTSEISLSPSIRWMQSMTGITLSIAKGYGESYQALGDAVFDINKIQDPRERERAIQEHSDKVVRLLNNLLNSAPQRKL